jgi:hypothetical protein
MHGRGTNDVDYQVIAPIKIAVKVIETRKLPMDRLQFPPKYRSNNSILTSTGSLLRPVVG